MRKNILLTGVLGLLALGTLQAQDFRLSPLPQVYENARRQHRHPDAL